MLSHYGWVRQTFFLVSVVLSCLSFTSGQTDTSTTNSAETAQSGFYPLPVLFYTPETGLAGGVAALYLFRDRLDSRTSSMGANFIYTAKQQIIAELEGDLYFDHGNYRTEGNLSFKKFPYKFYGIGNATSELAGESYTSQSFIAFLKIDKNVGSHFHAGPMFRLESVAMKEVDPAGTLATGTVTGSGGGTSAGIGFGVNWDSRDNTFATESGSLCQVLALVYRKEFSGDYNYADLRVDARKFFETGEGQVLAVQAAGRAVSGTVPFQAVPTFGGANLVRGYFEGRYRDNISAALQAEYRAHIWWRVGLVAFAGAGQVADKIERLALQRFWCAGGVGLRFLWSPKERVNIRLDYGIGNNSSGLYVTVSEAI